MRTIEELNESIDSTLERWKEERELKDYLEREERREIREHELELLKVWLSHSQEANE